MGTVIVVYLSHGLVGKDWEGLPVKLVSVTLPVTQAGEGTSVLGMAESHSHWLPSGSPLHCSKETQPSHVSLSRLLGLVGTEVQKASYPRAGTVWSKVLMAQERETHIWMGRLPMTNISSTLKIFLKAPCGPKLMLLCHHDPWMTFTESSSDP